MLRSVQACFMPSFIALACVTSGVLWRSCIGNGKGKVIPVHSIKACKMEV